MGIMLTIAEASAFATQHIGKTVTESNISYLIQYGRIDKFEKNNLVYVDQEQLVAYYESFKGKKEIEWKSILGDDTNWKLSFDDYKESETTKHVHRLHPYKGKFIPQLVEYFLDGHTDEFKKEVYFQPGDIVLDPFCGSGTTLVQASESGMHAIGIDISSFNAQISNCKIGVYDIEALKREITRITKALEEFEAALDIAVFETELLEKLYEFNSQYFPSPEFKKRVYRKEVVEKAYGEEKAQMFLPTFIELAKKYDISLSISEDSFLDKWYFETARREIHFVYRAIEETTDEPTKQILQVILSRTMRSCRATTHSDLATLIVPVYTTYYCTKHKKICKPLFSILKWWKTYSQDTVKRIAEFAILRTATQQRCFAADSATADISEYIASMGGAIYNTYRARKIKGIFCSPPYVGLINYHEQHAYAYELLGLDRHDEQEIGSMQKGSTKAARQKYVDDISSVLLNCKQYLADDYEVFIVANDKFGLYPKIAERAGMVIVEQFKRPVLNRTEKDKNAYSEIIFRMKEGKSTNANKRQEIAKVIIKLLKSRFDSFPADAAASRNAPFHKAFLQAFSEKFDVAGTSVDAMMSTSSWMHGLNTTLGQMFFESVAHILCGGEKRTFSGDDFMIYVEQERVISEIMTDLKNGTRLPNVAQEDADIAKAATGALVTGTNFTVDCYFENADSVVAIELKSVRPNSGETRGEKQKILKAKAALRNKYPGKDVKYYFGFPFDPTSTTDTDHCKERFMDSIIEFSKFCDADEILIADELWSYLSGEAGTMHELLDLIRSIATPDFMEKFMFLSTPSNMVSDPARYIEIAENWGLRDEVAIAKKLSLLESSPQEAVQVSLYSSAFDSSGKYNESRARTLIEA